MLIRLLSTLLFVTACLWPQTPALPGTPAGIALKAWLDAFNSGDPAQIREYFERYSPPGSADSLIAFRERTGGFQLLGIDNSEILLIDFHVKEMSSPVTALGTMEVSDSDPPKVVRFSLRAIPPGLTAADMKMKIDAVMKEHVIGEAIEKLNEHYVFPETASKMAEALRAHQAAGDYGTIDDAGRFAALLTEHLQAVSDDKHLRVNFTPKAPPAGEAKPDPEAEARRRTQMLRNNCAFEKAERLSSNIGYLKFNAFMNPAVCGPAATAAMNFLANVDAIIFDLRENGGGDPKMIAYISTYLFDEPTHLNDLYNRKEDSTTQYWTLPYVPGDRLAGKPVFVLTSKRTFSGAEEFSYNLKNLKRATIIGETTGGGAHPVSGHRIGGHFTIGVPFARAVNPISKTNWEGRGVEPDVKVPAAEALEVAKKIAAEEIKSRSAAGPE